MEHDTLIGICKKFFLMFFVSVIVVSSVFAEVSRDDAVAAIVQAERDVQEMAADNFSISSVSDSLVAANSSLERADFALLLMQNSTGELADKARVVLKGLDYQGFSYADVLNYTNDVAGRKKQAYLISDSINALETKVGDYRSQGINTSGAEAFILQAKSSFGKERYDEAESFISSADSELESRKADVASLNVLVKSGKGFFERNWQQLLFVFVVLVVVGFFVARKVRVARLKGRLDRLRAERVAVLRLKKKAQFDRFKTGSLSGVLYNTKVSFYDKKLSEVEESIPVVEAMLNKYIGNRERGIAVAKVVKNKAVKKKHRK